MENALRKLAKQLDVYDEASLTAMWDRLAEQVEKFEPTKEWETTALMLGMVQALRWKNQLFNYNWSESLRANSIQKKKGQENPWPEFSLDNPSPEAGANKNSATGPASNSASLGKKGGKVLSFGTIKNNEPV